jgi:hypothetical protein
LKAHEQSIYVASMTLCAINSAYIIQPKVTRLAELSGCNYRAVKPAVNRLFELGLFEKPPPLRARARAFQDEIREEEIREEKNSDTAYRETGSAAALGAAGSDSQTGSRDDVEQKPPDSAKPKAEPDPVMSRIWRDGVELLVGSMTGDTSKVRDRNARSLLGKLAKTYGNIELAKAIAATQAANAANPHEFLVGVLKRGEEVGKEKGRNGYGERGNNRPSSGQTIAQRSYRQQTDQD